jgi:excisionase family DNA binding protein
VSRSSIYMLITSGDVSSVRIGASRRIPAEALRRYVGPPRRWKGCEQRPIRAEGRHGPTASIGVSRPGRGVTGNRSLRPDLAVGLRPAGPAWLVRSGPHGAQGVGGHPYSSRPTKGRPGATISEKCVAIWPPRGRVDR